MLLFPCEAPVVPQAGIRAANQDPDEEVTPGGKKWLKLTPPTRSWRMTLPDSSVASIAEVNPNQRT